MGSIYFTLVLFYPFIIKNSFLHFFMYRSQARLANKALVPAFLGRKATTSHFLGRRAKISQRRR